VDPKDRSPSPDVGYSQAADDQEDSDGEMEKFTARGRLKRALISRDSESSQDTSYEDGAGVADRSIDNAELCDEEFAKKRSKTEKVLKPVKRVYASTPYSSTHKADVEYHGGIKIQGPKDRYAGPTGRPNEKGFFSEINSITIGKWLRIRLRRVQGD